MLYARLIVTMRHDSRGAISALIDLHLTLEIHVFRSMDTERKKRRNLFRIYNPKNIKKTAKCRHLE